MKCDSNSTQPTANEGNNTTGPDIMDEISSQATPGNMTSALSTVTRNVTGQDVTVETVEISQSSSENMTKSLSTGTGNVTGQNIKYNISSQSGQLSTISSTGQNIKNDRSSQSGQLSTGTINVSYHYIMGNMSSETSLENMTSDFSVDAINVTGGQDITGNISLKTFSENLTSALSTVTINVTRRDTTEEIASHTFSETRTRALSTFTKNGSLNSATRNFTTYFIKEVMPTGYNKTSYATSPAYDMRTWYSSPKTSPYTFPETAAFTSLWTTVFAGYTGNDTESDFWLVIPSSQGLSSSCAEIDHRIDVNLTQCKGIAFRLGANVLNFASDRCELRLCPTNDMWLDSFWGGMDVYMLRGEFATAENL